MAKGWLIFLLGLAACAGPEADAPPAKEPHKPEPRPAGHRRLVLHTMEAAVDDAGAFDALFRLRDPEARVEENARAEENGFAVIPLLPGAEGTTRLEGQRFPSYREWSQVTTIPEAAPTHLSVAAWRAAPRTDPLTVRKEGVPDRVIEGRIVETAIDVEVLTTDDGRLDVRITPVLVRDRGDDFERIAIEELRTRTITQPGRPIAVGGVRASLDSFGGAFFSYHRGGQWRKMIKILVLE